jgi:hypothetical protein
MRREGEERNREEVGKNAQARERERGRERDRK